MTTGHVTFHHSSLPVAIQLAEGSCLEGWPRSTQPCVSYCGRKVQSLPRSTFLRYDWYFSATIGISLLRAFLCYDSKILCYDWYLSATIGISLLRFKNSLLRFKISLLRLIGLFLCYDWYFSAPIDISLLVLQSPGSVESPPSGVIGKLVCCK